MTTENYYGGAGGALTETKTYTYTNFDAPYPLEPPYMPRLSKKLPASFTYNSGTMTIAYTFDANNRLTSETYSSSSSLYTIKYTY